MKTKHACSLHPVADYDHYKPYPDTNIISDIKTRILEWLGHVVRMGDFRLPKKILNTKLDKKRKIGRPKLDGLMTSKLI
jgi:hypothetical protein